MITEAVDFVISQSLHSTFAICVYWIPLVICAIGYFIEAISRYRNDLTNCTKASYFPTLTYGRILGTIFLTLVPVVNLVSAIGTNVGRITTFLGKLFDIPLVSHKPSSK